MTITTELRMMENAVSAADANRNFSHIPREVRAGASYPLTAHGKPVARIVPCEPADAAPAAARSALLQRLRDQLLTDIGPWSRDEVYER